MEVAVPHGLFIQSCYWRNEFLFGEARPLCLRVSLVEQAVISFGFPSSFGAEPAIRGGMQLPERAPAGTGWRLAQMFSELYAEYSVLSGINGHGSMKPCLPQMRTELRSNTACSCVQTGSKGKSALQGVRSPSIRKEREKIFSLYSG